MSNQPSARGLGGQPSTRMAKKHEQYDFRQRPKGPLAVCETWLRQQLGDGPKPEETLKAEAAKAGILATILGQARTRLVVVLENGDWCLQGSKDDPDAEAIDATPQVEVVNEGSEVPIDPFQTSEDQFAITAEERAMYGIRPDETIKWERDPGYWQQHAPGDPVSMTMRGVPGARAIVHNGDFVRNGPDTVLMAIPKAYVERQREEQRREQLELEADLAGRLRKDSFTLRANTDDENVRAIAEVNSEQNRRAGLIGPMSPSSGQGLEEYIRNRGLKEADIRREAVRHAMGPYYSNDIPDSKIQEAFEKGVISLVEAGPGDVGYTGAEPSRGRGNGGQFTSLPSGPIRPRNLMKR